MYQVESFKKQKNESSEPERIRIVSLDVNICDFEILVRKIASLVDRERGAYICMSTVHMIMESYDDSEYNTMVNSADMVVPDGMPLVWIQKLQGIRDADRVRGNDLMIGLFDYASKNGLSIGFYGGKKSVVEALLERANIDYPNLKIAYSHSPPFRPLTVEEDNSIIQEIREQAPDILFVGLGCPKQERWMAANKDKLNSVMIGVGAAFDFYAGNIAECPKFLQRIGLEWLFRLTQEPRRLWKRYLFQNPRFVALAVMQLTGLRKFD